MFCLTMMALSQHTPIVRGRQADPDKATKGKEKKIRNFFGGVRFVYNNKAFSWLRDLPTPRRDCRGNTLGQPQLVQWQVHEKFTNPDHQSGPRFLLPSSLADRGRAEAFYANLPKTPTGLN